LFILAVRIVSIAAGLLGGLIPAMKSIRSDAAGLAAMLPLLSREVNRVDPDVPIAETITLPLQLAGELTTVLSS